MTRLERATSPGTLETMESRERPANTVELITTVALAVSTVVAITAVSIGMARADGFALGADIDSAPFAIALLIGCLLLVMGGLTAIMAYGSTGKV